MSDLFVPPAGAMQFEVVRDWHGEMDQTFADRGPLVFWVLEIAASSRPIRKSIRPECTHTRLFLPIVETMPDWLPGKKNWNASKFICECVGRIIE